MGLDAVGGINPQQNANKSSNRGKGPAELAKALGISVDKLEKMSPEDVQKLAKEKKVDLREYGRPDPPPKQQVGAQGPSVFKSK